MKCWRALAVFTTGTVKMLLVAAPSWALLVCGATLIVVSFWPIMLFGVLWAIAVSPYIPRLRRLMGLAIALLVAVLEPAVCIMFVALVGLAYVVVKPYVDTSMALETGWVTIWWPSVCEVDYNTPLAPFVRRDRGILCSGFHDVFLDAMFALCVLVALHLFVLIGLADIRDGTLNRRGMDFFRDSGSDTGSSSSGAASRDSDGASTSLAPSDSDQEALEDVSVDGTSAVGSQEERRDLGSLLDVLIGLLFAILGLVVGGSGCIVIFVLKGPAALLSAWFSSGRLMLVFVAEVYRVQGLGMAIIVMFFSTVLLVILPLFLVIMLLLLLLTELIGSLVWPAYVAAGWLWVARRRSRTQACEDASCQPFMEGAKAVYQVIWVADLLANSAICADVEAFSQAVSDMGEIAVGARTGLRRESQRVSWLPPVRIGLFSGAWQMREEDLQSLGFGHGWTLEVVNQVWNNFFEQCLVVGSDALRDGLLTREECEDAEPFVILGITAVVVLRAIQRSPPGSNLELADGMLLHEGNRPSHPDVRAIWESVLVAKALLESAELTSEELRLLEATTLLGTTELDGRPASCAELLGDFTKLPPDRKTTLNNIRTELTGVALAMSRKNVFQGRFMGVLEELGQDGARCGRSGCKCCPALCCSSVFCSRCSCTCCC